MNIHYLPRPCQERGNIGISSICLQEFKNIMENNVLDDGNSFLGLIASSVGIIYFIIYCFWMRLGTKVIILVFCPTVDDCCEQCWWTEMVIVWSSKFLQIGSGFAISLRIGSKAREILTICASSNT